MCLDNIYAIKEGPMTNDFAAYAAAVILAGQDRSGDIKAARSLIHLIRTDYLKRQAKYIISGISMADAEMDTCCEIPGLDKSIDARVAILALLARTPRQPATLLRDVKAIAPMKDIDVSWGIVRLLDKDDDQKIEQDARGYLVLHQ